MQTPPQHRPPFPGGEGVPRTPPPTVYGRKRRLPRLVVLPVLLVVLVVGGWFGLSAAVFLLTAQSTKSEPPEVKQALAGGSSLLSGSNILVLGSDMRDTGPDSGIPGRSDSMMLVRAGLGSVHRLSILRDSYAPIPGHNPQKINAAYAFGGPALAAKTVEGFLGNGLQINHVIEFNFDDFPKLIDAVGGVDITLNQCVQSQPFEGRSVQLGPGSHHLHGDEALAFSRVRKNRCAPNEDDRARVARQQMVLAALQNKLSSPQTIAHLPWISSQVPKSIRTDMNGPQLLTLSSDMATAGSTQTEVLQTYNPGGGPGDSALISPAAKQQAVQQLYGR